MRETVGRALLWLFVIDLGIALGAGLYEARIVVPEWLVAVDSARHWNAESVRAHDTGRRFWAFVTTVPLTLLTLANLVAAWRAPGTLRRWWLAAAGVALADRVLTIAYFIPTMVRLSSAGDTAEAVAAATRWANLNYLRHALVLTAFLAALKAFALFHERRGSGHPA